MNIYKCEICGTTVEEITFGVSHPSCCGQLMTPVKAGTTDGAKEKHVPVVKVEGNKVEVKIGEAEHPMAEEHYIEWIAIETTNGMQKKCLKPGQAPKAEFLLADGETLVATYDYCNIHELWKA